MNYWKLFIDGASRNNPGPSGAGIYILKNGTAVIEKNFFLGTRTNNQAEYLALVLGICVLKNYLSAEDLVFIVSDSQLLVRQINGDYKVKEHNLQILHRAVHKLLISCAYTIGHVMREDNKNADRLANQAIDQCTPIPSEYKILLRQYEIIIN
jgi:ribonuclease HI